MYYINSNLNVIIAINQYFWINSILLLVFFSSPYAHIFAFLLDQTAGIIEYGNIYGYDNVV